MRHCGGDAEETQWQMVAGRGTPTVPSLPLRELADKFLWCVEVQLPSREGGARMGNLEFHRLLRLRVFRPKP